MLREYEEGDSDGQIKVGAIFGKFGGSKVNRNFFGGKAKIGVDESGADAFARFGDSFVGHADDTKTGETPIGVPFDGNEAPRVALGDGGINFCDHSDS